MKAKLLATVAIALLALVQPAGAAPPDGSALYLDCASDAFSQQAHCVGYLLGLWDGITTMGQIKEASLRADYAFCSKGVVKAEQLRLVYLRWAQANPKFLGYDRGTVALASLYDAFPCAAPKASASKPELTQ